MQTEIQFSDLDFQAALDRAFEHYTAQYHHGLPCRTEEQSRARMICSVLCVLGAEEASDLSDAEIERCLGGCVGAAGLIPFAKSHRELLLRSAERSAS